ncbi:MAG: alpha/beta hydrolase [Desulfobacterales bacterium]|jgi:alpha/beta superfamily hydrolase
MEEKVRFFSEEISLEGLMTPASGKRGVVITHPHPLYGGDMYNPVVECLQGVFTARGFATLRFNFRGVGKSEGGYGEGDGEVNDVLAAAGFLQQQGATGKIELAGYSFGAWVNARVPRGQKGIGRLTMVSPPVAFIDFSDIPAMPNLFLVVTGSRDDIAPAEEIRPQLSRWNPAAVFEIIEGADHFYWGHLDVLREVLERHVHPEAAGKRTP